MGRVFVAGSINMDVVATADRHPKVGETVAGRQVLYFPGGKGANQAVAAVRLGARTTLIGRLGKDSFGAELKAFLCDQGIDLGYVVETADAHTGTAIITVAQADNTIVVVPGANGLVGAEDVEVVPLLAGDVAVSQFEIPMPAIAAFFRRARAAGATTLLNPAPAQAMSRELLALVDILVLNETELGFLAGSELSESDEAAKIIAVARQLQAREDQTICVTLGKRGVLALAGGEEIAVPGRVVKALDTTGAGDCMSATFLSRIIDGDTIPEACAYACAAGSYSTLFPGANTVQISDEKIREFLKKSS